MNERDGAHHITLSPLAAYPNVLPGLKKPTLLICLSLKIVLPLFYSLC